MLQRRCCHSLWTSARAGGPAALQKVLSPDPSGPRQGLQGGGQERGRGPWRCHPRRVCGLCGCPPAAPLALAPLLPTSPARPRGPSGPGSPCGKRGQVSLGEVRRGHHELPGDEAPDGRGWCWNSRPARSASCSRAGVTGPRGGSPSFETFPHISQANGCPWSSPQRQRPPAPATGAHVCGGVGGCWRVEQCTACTAVHGVCGTVLAQASDQGVTAALPDPAGSAP